MLSPEFERAARADALKEIRAIKRSALGYAFLVVFIAGILVGFYFGRNIAH